MRGCVYVCANLDDFFKYLVKYTIYSINFHFYVLTNSGAGTGAYRIARSYT